MRRFYCKYENNQLLTYVNDENGKKRIICTKSDDIIKWIRNFSSFNTYVKIFPKDIELVCPDKQASIYILDFREILSNEETEIIKKYIDRASSNGFFDMNKSAINSKNPKKGEAGRIARTTSLMLIIGGISLFSVFPGFSMSKKNTNQNNMTNKVKASISSVTSKEKKQNNNEEFIDNIIESNFKSNSPQNFTETVNKQISIALKNKKLKLLKEKKQELSIQNKNTVDINSKRDFLLKYFNIKSSDTLDSFFNEFVNTMYDYGQKYTINDLIELFYQVANISLEHKIEVVKKAFNLDNEKLDAVAATLIGEGYGGGEKYIDVFAVTTTAMNHLQYPAWVNDISRERGEELGHNLYGHTCYKYQFNAYDSYLYYDFLGKRDIRGFNSVIDTLYLNSEYGLILHDYTQFRGAWIEVSNGKTFEEGGNKYLDRRSPEDRTMTEALQKNSNMP